MDKTEIVYRAVRDALKDSEIVSLRCPRKWKGESFTDREIPVVAVKVDCYNKYRVFKIVSDLASEHRVAVKYNHGYRNSQSEVLVYIHLKKNESK